MDCGRHWPTTIHIHAPSCPAHRTCDVFRWHAKNSGKTVPSLSLRVWVMIAPSYSWLPQHFVPVTGFRVDMWPTSGQWNIKRSLLRFYTVEISYSVMEGKPPLLSFLSPYDTEVKWCLKHQYFLTTLSHQINLRAPSLPTSRSVKWSNIFFSLMPLLITLLLSNEHILRWNPIIALPWD